MKDERQSPRDGLRVYVHSVEFLCQARQKCRDRNASVALAAQKLRSEADVAVGIKPFTIVDKSRTPPSGDKHDYVSMGPYWWPNPDTPDGLPYVRRDGEHNLETEDFDRPKLRAITQAASTLSLAGFLFDQQAYADKAVQLLRVFFLDDQTRMNPNLEFGQGIPGRCDGRGIGIIETTSLATELVDAIGLLGASSAVRKDDQKGLEAWFGAYLDWLLGSSHGRDEGQQNNNHGTAYDLQAAVFSLFVGRERTARNVLQAVAEQRIAAQVEPDGRQPHELARTKALSYSSSNLNLLFCLACVAKGLGIDLWQFETGDGRSIRRALNWLVPFWTGTTSWKYQQIVPFEYERAFDLLRKAAWAYGDARYEEAISKLPLMEEDRTHRRINLYYPQMA